MSTKYLPHLGLMSEMVMVEVEGRVVVYCCGKGNGGKGEGKASEEKGPKTWCLLMSMPGFHCQVPIPSRKQKQQNRGTDGWMADGRWRVAVAPV